MTIYESIKKDHAKVKGLLDELVQSSESNNDDWKGLVDQIRDELIPHSRAEEAVFYNAIRELDHESGLIAHAYAEHATAEAELRALQAMKAIDVNWKALANKLREDLLHHVKEEEGKVFSAAEKIFSDEEARQIATAFAKLKPMIKEQSFAGTTMDMITNLLPRRFVSSFLKSFDKAYDDRQQKRAS